MTTLGWFTAFIAVAAVVLIAIGFVIVGVVFGVSWTLKKSVNKAIDFVEELDLDRRLGPLQFVEIQSVGGKPLKVAYRQSGPEGAVRDVVCLHGIGASMIIFRRLVPILNDRYRVTCIDWPGFGDSEKPRELDYSLDEQAEHGKRAIEALGLNRPLAVASSMGSAISLWMAKLFPDLFRGLVALGPAVEPTRMPQAALHFGRFSDHFHRINNPLAMRAAVAQVIARRELITPALVALYRRPYLDDGASSSAFFKAFRVLADTRLPNGLGSLQTPLLIMHGLGDRLVRRRGCDKLARTVANSTLIIHPTAGHHIMEDEPQFVADEIAKFESRSGS